MAIIVVAVFSTTFSLKADSYSTYSYPSYKSLNNVELLQNENQVYLIGTSGRNVQIDAIYPNCYSVTLTLEHSVNTYNLFGDSLVLICPAPQLSQTQIVTYNIDSDIISSFYISCTWYYESSQIAYSENCIYLADNYGNVMQYTERGKLVTTYDIHSDRCNLMCDYNGTVYCITNNSLYEIFDQTLYHICSCNIDAPARFVSNDTFVDDTGYFYTFGSNGIFNIVDFQNTSRFPSGGIYNDCVITADFNTINAVNINRNESDSYIKLNRQIESICVVDDTILAFVYQNGFPAVCHIKVSELIKYNRKNSDDSYTPDMSDYISSEVYEIDHDKQWIFGITPSTTVAKFKHNIQHDDFEISFVRNDSKILESGNIGTGTIVTFYNDVMSIDYELSVKGDLTGEGNVNSRDKRVLFDYLLENEIPTGVYIDAADLDYSGYIDVVDLVVLKTEIDDINL